MTVWGNHSAEPVPRPRPRRGRRRERRLPQVGDQAWIEDEFIPTVAKRGAAIIEARGASSAASAANAAIDHVHDWVLGTPDGDWVSMGVPSDGSYGVARGGDLRFPVHLLGWRVRDRRGPRDRRLLARADRRERRRARGRARHGQRPRPRLSLMRPRARGLAALRWLRSRGPSSSPCRPRRGRPSRGRRSSA